MDLNFVIKNHFKIRFWSLIQDYESKGFHDIYFTIFVFIFTILVVKLHYYENLSIMLKLCIVFLVKSIGRVNEIAGIKVSS